MVTRIRHGATSASKSDEYLDLMRTVAIPDYRSTPDNKGAYALRRVVGDTAHLVDALIPLLANMQGLSGEWLDSIGEHGELVL
jgi:hypothetical protein